MARKKRRGQTPPTETETSDDWVDDATTDDAPTGDPVEEPRPPEKSEPKTVQRVGATVAPANVPGKLRKHLK